MAIRRADGPLGVGLSDRPHILQIRTVCARGRAARGVRPTARSNCLPGRGRARRGRSVNPREIVVDTRRRSRPRERRRARGRAARVDERPTDRTDRRRAMGQGQSADGADGADGRNGRGKKKEKKKYVPPAPPMRVGKKKKKTGIEGSTRLPNVAPQSKCKLRMLKLERVKDYLLMEEEFVGNQERLKPREERDEDEQSKIDEMRGAPMSVGSLEEIIDDTHGIVSSSIGPEYYVNIASFVDKSQLEPGCAVLLHHKNSAVVGTLADDVDPMVSVMKVDKAPLESYADVGGLEDQIQEIKEAVELPLTHPELYEDIGIKPPKGVILYGAPGLGRRCSLRRWRTQRARLSCASSGSELIQKYLGDGPKLVRELFRVAEEMSPSIVFMDEIDAVGTKRYDSQSGGEREIQRTMFELLNQMDGFDARGDVKVIMATNRIESLDPALLRPGRIDRKIEFPLPDVKTKRHIFGIHTGRMNLSADVTVGGIRHGQGRTLGRRHQGAVHRSRFARLT